MCACLQAGERAGEKQKACAKSCDILTLLRASEYLGVPQGSHCLLLGAFWTRGKKCIGGKGFPRSRPGQETMLRQHNSGFRWPALHQPGDRRETPRSKVPKMRQRLAKGAFVSVLPKANPGFT